GLERDLVAGAAPPAPLDVLGEAAAAGRLVEQPAVEERHPVAPGAVELRRRQGRQVPSLVSTHHRPAVARAGSAAGPATRVHHRGPRPPAPGRAGVTGALFRNGTPVGGARSAQWSHATSPGG